MSALERLALLTAHGTTGIGGRGGKDRVTAQDVAAAMAMAGLGEGHTKLAIARVVGASEPVRVREWSTYWIGRVKLLAIERGWYSDRTARFALLTSVDCLSPRWCGHCNGAGAHHNQRQCVVCEGRKTVPWTDAEQAERMTVHERVWQSEWSPRYTRAMARLAVWESDAERALGRAMR